MSDNNWYKKSLYEQSWHNYRNEDANYRSTMWRYIIFSAGLVIAATRAGPATRFLGILGLFISVATIFYIGRVTLYSWRWLLAKDSAIGSNEANSEIERLKEAQKRVSFVSLVPGWIAAHSFPLAGFVFFILMIIYGSEMWGRAMPVDVDLTKRLLVPR